MAPQRVRYYTPNESFPIVRTAIIIIQFLMIAPTLFARLDFYQKKYLVFFLSFLYTYAYHHHHRLL